MNINVERKTSKNVNKKLSNKSQTKDNKRDCDSLQLLPQNDYNQILNTINSEISEVSEIHAQNVSDLIEQEQATIWREDDRDSQRPILFKQNINNFVMDSPKSNSHRTRLSLFKPSVFPFQPQIRSEKLVVNTKDNNENNNNKFAFKKLESAKRLDYLYNQNLNNSLFQSIIVFIYMVSCWLYYEVNEKKTFETQVLFLQIICFICSILLSITLIFDYYVQCIIKGERFRMDKDIFLNSLISILFLVGNIIVLLIHPTPLLNGIKVPIYSSIFPNVVIQMEVNYLIAIISQTRIYLILKHFILCSVFNSSSFHRICRSRSINLTMFFSIKCLLRHNAYKLLFIVCIFQVIYCIFALRILEKVFEPYIEREFGYLTTLWYLLETGISIGYGDILPVSDFGKLLGMLFCLYSMVLASTLLLALENSHSLDQQEDHPIKLLYKINANSRKVDDETLDAKKIISRFTKLALGLKNKVITKQNETTKSERDKLLLQLFNLKKQRRLHLMGNSFNNNNNVYVELEYLNTEVSNLSSLAMNLTNLATKMTILTERKLKKHINM